VKNKEKKTVYSARATFDKKCFEIYGFLRIYAVFNV
jgi:hypothetical protein